jgi:NAD(P)H-flavin reductase
MVASLMADLHALPVVSVTPCGDRLVLLALDGADGAVGASHTTPGQYVKVRAFGDDVPRPFALANKPGTRALELLIRAPEERRAHLLGLRPGDRISVSPCQGPGYAMNALLGKDVWLVGVGTGIAPIRACLESMLDKRGRYGDITLLYGVRSADELAFSARFGTWTGLGVRVVPVLSRPDATWAGARGYVQDHLPKTLPHPSRTSCVLCGMPEMEKAVAQALLEWGVGPDQVLRNW